MSFVIQNKSTSQCIGNETSKNFTLFRIFNHNSTIGCHRIKFINQILEEINGTIRFFFTTINANDLRFTV